MMTLSELQQKLIQKEFDAYIVTRNNVFLGQDVLPEENKILRLTGFTGSAGHLIVFQKKAVLLVDGRYDIQARQQTDSSQIEVVCTRDSIGTWIQNNVKESCKFIYSPWCHSISEVDYWKRVLDDHLFIEDKGDFFDAGVAQTEAEVFELEEKFAGISSDEKISYLTRFCQERQLDAFLLCECDSVSWLMNLRSNLLPDTPIFRGFALVSATGEVSLFQTDFSKLSEELETYRDKTIGLSYNRTPKKFQALIKEKHIWIRNVNNPVADWKAAKNPIEIAGFKACHKRDAVAVCRFLKWLEEINYKTDELGVVAKLHDFRSQGENFYGNSFETIAGSGANGAIIHYQPSAETNLPLKEGSLLLLDSGAQYFDGTTDITRTIAVGTPSPEMVDSYTQVLKAHLAVALALLPPNTPGLVPDTLARAALWRYGKDYAHGTGHGVGHFLNVHEGPQSLSLKSLAPLKKDMVTSIEPGFYKEGVYGIRIENLALTVETSTKFMSPMLKFEPLTLVPFDRKLINKSLLTVEEINWINAYHKKVETEILPLLEPKAADWLKKACAEI